MVPISTSKAPDFAAQLGELGGNATNQGGGGVDLALHGGQLGKLHGAKGIALRLDANGIGAVFTDGSQGM